MTQSSKDIDVVNDTLDISSINISSLDMSQYVYSTNNMWSGSHGHGMHGAIGSTGSIGTYSVNIGSGANGTSWSTMPTINAVNWNSTAGSKSGLHVKDDAEFEGDIKWKGRSLGKLLESIEDRLAIISNPNPKKIEKFAALKKAYDHYKLMEKLIGDDFDDTADK